MSNCVTTMRDNTFSGAFFHWSAPFYSIGKCVITPRRLVELKKIQGYNRREDGCGHCPLFYFYIRTFVSYQPEKLKLLVARLKLKPET